MTDIRHNNDTADFTRRDIYTTPDGFFEAEKQRLSALARGPWQVRLSCRDTPGTDAAAPNYRTGKHDVHGASPDRQPLIPRHAARND